MEMIETERKDWKTRTNAEEIELNRRTKESMFSRELDKGKWRKWSDKREKSERGRKGKQHEKNKLSRANAAEKLFKVDTNHALIPS